MTKQRPASSTFCPPSPPSRYRSFPDAGTTKLLRENSSPRTKQISFRKQFDADVASPMSPRLNIELTDDWRVRRRFVCPGTWRGFDPTSISILSASVSRTEAVSRRLQPLFFRESNVLSLIDCVIARTPVGSSFPFEIQSKAAYRLQDTVAQSVLQRCSCSEFATVDRRIT